MGALAPGLRIVQDWVSGQLSGGDVGECTHFLRTRESSCGPLGNLRSTCPGTEKETAVTTPAIFDLLLSEFLGCFVIGYEYQTLRKESGILSHEAVTRKHVNES